jgi:glycosyltransferase involved in cell wall biosynthesis
MQAVLISIITINFNNCVGLKRTIESVGAMKFSDYEYIVVDGNSSDDSKNLIVNSEIIDKYLIELDSGIYDAMNKGAKLASGKFLYFLNSGDIVISDLFSNLHEVKNIFQYDVIYGSTKSISTDYVDISRKKEVIFYDIPFCHQSVFLNREVFRSFEFNLKYKLAADYELFLKVYLAGYRFYQTSFFFSKIDTNGLSHTKQLSVVLEYIQIIFDVHKFGKSIFFFITFIAKKYKFIMRLLFKNLLK